MPRLTLAMLGIATLIVIPASPVMADEAPWVADARNIATTMPPKMMEVLKEETKKSGPANATVVCREKAPAMSKTVSEQSGWNIRRVSLRERNPKAVPDDWERAVLEDFDRRAAAGEDGAKMEKSELVRQTLGEHVFDYFLRNKRSEWQDYRRQVSAYELDRYLPVL